MTNQENTLKVIRYIQDTVEGLKEPTFGCVVKVYGEKLFKHGVPFIIGQGECYWDDERDEIVTFEHVSFSKYEIIGHEPQLNHLLLAIRNTNHLECALLEILEDKNALYLRGLNDNDMAESSEDYIPEGSFDYDMQESVLWNLENNPELCQYLLTLFNL